MRYDLELIDQFCREIGLLSRICSTERLEVELSKTAVLCFQNAEHEQDGLVGFEGTPWHTHDDFTFCDGRGNYVELNHLDVLAGLKTGQVLLCELWRGGLVSDRWLIHRDYNNEFQYMQEGEEIRICRSTVMGPSSPK
jgi:hypothetical protein